MAAITVWQFPSFCYIYLAGGNLDFCRGRRERQGGPKWGSFCRAAIIFVCQLISSLESAVDRHFYDRLTSELVLSRVRGRTTLFGMKDPILGCMVAFISNPSIFSISVGGGSGLGKCREQEHWFIDFFRQIVSYFTFHSETAFPSFSISAVPGRWMKWT